MQKLELFQLEAVAAGANGDTAITVIGALACAGAAFWPIGTAMFGPTCGGMLLAAALT